MIGSQQDGTGFCINIAPTWLQKLTGPSHKAIQGEPSLHRIRDCKVKSTTVGSLTDPIADPLLLECVIVASRRISLFQERDWRCFPPATPEGLLLLVFV